jgi:hypothetical protein
MYISPSCCSRPGSEFIKFVSLMHHGSFWYPVLMSLSSVGSGAMLRMSPTVLMSMLKLAGMLMVCLAYSGRSSTLGGK